MQKPICSWKEGKASKVGSTVTVQTLTGKMEDVYGYAEGKAAVLLRGIFHYRIPNSPSSTSEARIGGGADIHFTTLSGYNT
jgi:hypothetical protein